MAVGLLGTKLGMTRIFGEDGEAVPVTVIKVGPCVVVQRKTTERDGYEAVQVGYEQRKRRRTNSPMSGHFESRGIAPQKHLREFRLSADEQYQEGQELTLELFVEGQLVDISANSKGRGFAGVMKRHGFHGGPASHGSKVHRSPQSAGATDAQRVFPGQGMPGHMGNKRVTIRGLKLVALDREDSLLLVKGSVPGAPGGLVEIRPSNKAERK